MLLVAVDDMRADPVGIMAAEKILLHLGDSGRESLAQFLQTPVEFGGGYPGLFIGEIIRGSKSEVVIHHRIEFVTLEVGLQLRHRIDQFGRDVSVRIDAFDHLAPLLPKRMGHTEGDVQAPTVDTVGRIAIAIGIHPATGRGENVVTRTGYDPLLILPEFRQRFVPEPAFVIELRAFFLIAPGIDREPIGVSRILLLLHHIEKRPTAQAHVIEHTVKNHPNSARVALLDQLESQFVGRSPQPRRRVSRILLRNQFPVTGRIGAEIWIDMMVTHAVVFVRRGRIEDWI